MTLNSLDDLERAAATVAVGPRVTKAQVEACVANTEYKVVGETTFCILTLVNGFVVSGTSGCINPANFNQELGEAAAHKRAMEEVWRLEGYAAKDRAYRDAPLGDAQLQWLAERFCAAQLPKSVCADLCATRQGPGRSGTNLLSVAEAKEVLAFVLAR